MKLVETLIVSFTIWNEHPGRMASSRNFMCIKRPVLTLDQINALVPSKKGALIRVRLSMRAGNLFSHLR